MKKVLAYLAPLLITSCLTLNAEDTESDGGVLENEMETHAESKLKWVRTHGDSFHVEDQNSSYSYEKNEDVQPTGSSKYSINRTKEVDVEGSSDGSRKWTRSDSKTNSKDKSGYTVQASGSTQVREDGYDTESNRVTEITDARGRKSVTTDSRSLSSTTIGNRETWVGESTTSDELSTQNIHATGTVDQREDGYDSHSEHNIETDYANGVSTHNEKITDGSTTDNAVGGTDTHYVEKEDLSGKNITDTQTETVTERNTHKSEKEHGYTEKETVTTTHGGRPKTKEETGKTVTTKLSNGYKYVRTIRGSNNTGGKWKEIETTQIIWNKKKTQQIKTIKTVYSSSFAARWERNYERKITNLKNGSQRIQMTDEHTYHNSPPTKKRTDGIIFKNKTNEGTWSYTGKEWNYYSGSLRDTRTVTETRNAPEAISYTEETDDLL